MMLLLAALVQTIAAQKTCESLQADSTTAWRTAALLNGPSATITANWPSCMGWEVMTIYGPLDASAPGTAPSRYWVIRHDEERQGGNIKTSWADSRSCPALVPALNALSKLSFTISLDGFHPVDSLSFPTPATGGIWFTIHAYLARQSDQRFAGITVSSNEGAIAAWGRDFLDRMKPCWVEAKPEMPG